MKRLSFTVEMTVVTDSSGTTTDFIYGTDGWTTLPTDTPANTAVRGLVANPGQIRRELFSGARVTGPVRPSFGQIILSNADGHFDALMDYGIAGSKITVRYGEIGTAYPSAWTTVYIAYAYSLIVDFTECRILVRDRLWMLDKPIVTDNIGILGTLAGSGETSRKLQLVFGEPGYFEPILLDANEQAYLVQGNATLLDPGTTWAPLKSWVYDGGVALTNGGEYASEADYLADTPSAGNFRFYAAPLGPLLFKVGSPPAFDLRVRSVGRLKNDPSDSPMPWNFVDLCQRAGLTDVTAATIASGSSVKSVGNYLVDGDQTYLDVMSDVATYKQTAFGFNRLDQFFSTDLSLPSWLGASTYTFNVHNSKRIIRQPVPGMEVPVWQVSVKAGRAWPSRVATSLSAAWHDVFTRQYQVSFTGSADSVRTENPGAEIASVEIVGNEFTSQFEWFYFVQRYIMLFGARRDLIMVTAPLNEDTIAIDLNDKVTLDVPRLGCDGGRDFIVITQDLNLRDRTATFGLWGGDQGTAGVVLSGGGSGGGSTKIRASVFAKSIGDFTFKGAATGTVTGAEASFGKSIGEFTLAGAITSSVSADPYWEDVLLLLKMEGSGDTLIDSSKYARTVTTNSSGSLTVPITQGSGAFSGFPSVQVEINSSPDDPTNWSVSHASDFKVPVMTVEYFWYQTSSSNHSTAPAHINLPGYLYQGTYSNTENFTYRVGVDTSVQLGAGSLTYSTVHHIATVIDDTANTVEVWMDGTRIVNTAYPYTFDPTAIFIGDMGIGSTTSAATYEMSQVRVTAARRYSGATITVPDGPFPDATSGIPPYGGTWNMTFSSDFTVAQFAPEIITIGIGESDITALGVISSDTPLPGIGNIVHYDGAGSTADRIQLSCLSNVPAVYAFTLTYRMPNNAIVGTSSHTITFVPPYTGTWSLTPNDTSFSEGIAGSESIAVVTSDVTAITIQVMEGPIDGLTFTPVYGGAGSTVDEIIVSGTPTTAGVYSVILRHLLNDTHGTPLGQSTHTITVNP